MSNIKECCFECASKLGAKIHNENIVIWQASVCGICGEYTSCLPPFEYDRNKRLMNYEVKQGEA